MAGFALVFPGQGAQLVGMGRDLFERDPVARDVFDEADEVLGFGLAELCFTGPADKLQDTGNAQPAILTVSVAGLRALQQRLGSAYRAVVTAGHSLGEYSALVAAGALTFADALRLVRERGRLMKCAGELAPGTMVAVLGLGEETLQSICSEVARLGVVVVANHNAPGQSVLSGEARAVEEAARLARAAGASRTVPLAVAGAFHSPLMAPAAREFEAVLAQVPVADAALPCVGNVSAMPLIRAEDIRDELRRQLAAPVRWADSLRRMRGLGATLFVEVGPGSVLSGLARRTLEGVRTASVGDVAGLDRIEQILQLESARGGR